MNLIYLPIHHIGKGRNADNASEIRPHIRLLIIINQGRKHMQCYLVYKRTLESICFYWWNGVSIDVHIIKSSAAVEGVIAYAGHTLRDGDGGEAGTVHKDGMYVVYIRFAHNRKVSYLRTSWMVNDKGLSRNKKDIIDPYNVFVPVSVS